MTPVSMTANDVRMKLVDDERNDLLCSVRTDSRLPMLPSTSNMGGKY